MELLFEIGVEELPYQFARDSTKIIPSIFLELLEKNELEAKEVHCYATPRRLTLIGRGLPNKQPDKILEIFGPPLEKAYDKDGNPTQALVGFLKKQGISLEKLEEVVVKGGRVSLKKEIEGKSTYLILKEMLPELIRRIPLPIAMKWNVEHGPFIRPVHWIVALLDGDVIEFEIFGVHSGNKTKGHRFLSNKWIELRSIGDYFNILKENFVIVDQWERKEEILRQLKEIGNQHKVNPILDEELLEEVAFLVEYPYGIYGEFPEEFLNIPTPVIITTMKHHQRYFAVQGSNGKLAPGFIAFSNTIVKEPDVVKSGYERVLKARLNDARFFYEQDRKVRLESYTEKLSEIIFHEKLGTVLDKTKRIESIGVELANTIGYPYIEKVERTSKLIKADLKTQMVYEFPELQGVIGEIYAREDGEDEEVCVAIREHYMPQGEGGELPHSPLGILMALADKFDTVWGSWVIGERVTSTKDPLGLRRNILGIVRIIIERRVELSLREVWQILDMVYRKAGIKYEKDKAAVIEELEEFIGGRLRSYFGAKGVKKDTIEAALSVSYDNLLELSERIEAIEKLRQDKEFENLGVAFKRAFNIVNKEYKGGEVSEELFVHEAERNLYKALLSVESEVKGLIKERRYFEALKMVGNSLRGPIDTFFDTEKGVFVMDENLSLRSNRLALLKRISDLVRSIAHFDKLQFEL